LSQALTVRSSTLGFRGPRPLHRGRPILLALLALLATLLLRLALALLELLAALLL
jgi:hypothetical protein